MSRAFLVPAGDRGHKVFGLMVGDQVYGCAAETTASEPGASATRMGAGQFDQQIELGGAIFEKGARAFVALKHVLAELPMVFVAQGAFTRDDARDFRDDVAGAFVFALGQFGFICFEPA